LTAVLAEVGAGLRDAPTPPAGPATTAAAASSSSPEGVSRPGRPPAPALGPGTAIGGAIGSLYCTLKRLTAAAVSVPAPAGPSSISSVSGEGGRGEAAARRARLCAAVRALRRAVPHTGRMAFGPADGARALYRAVEAVSAARPGAGAGVQGSTDDGSSSGGGGGGGLSGHDAAVTQVAPVVCLSLSLALSLTHYPPHPPQCTQMRRWGEAWAEEEELPSDWDSGAGAGADTATGKRRARVQAPVESPI